MKVNQQKYSLEQVKQWADYLTNHTLTEVSEHFNVPYKSAVNLLNRYGYRKPSRVQTKIRRLNNATIDYFQTIDSAEKAYFLGYLFSDGYICSGNYNCSKQMSLAVQLQDRYIIDRLHANMQLNTKINVYKNSAKLVVTNLQLYNDLVALGMKEDKSHQDYTLPLIPDEFMNSFILGYFDGDGCITIKASHAIVVSICCNSYVFLESMQKYLESVGIFTRLNTEKRHNGSDFYVLYLKGRTNQLAFKEFVYKDSPIYLTRKYDKFMKIPCKS